MEKTLWHTLKSERVIESLDSSLNGLSSKQAEQRLKEVGENKLPSKKRTSPFVILFNQLKSPLIYILLIAGIVKLFLHEYLDSGIILTAVLVNTVIGFIQESKAENALEKLQSYVTYKAKVFRDGKKIGIDSKSIVPGDIVLLEAGDRVPADARIIKSSDLEVNEASLTGESVPVEKEDVLVDKGAIVGDRVNMAHMGTVVTKGSATAVVTGTGINTEIGEVADLLHQTENDATPLQERMERLGKLLSYLVLGIAIFIIIVGLIRSLDIFDLFETAVAVAVASIPEGLVVGITVILTLGMQNILKEKALVRRLVATETLGSTSVICSDKTGTLTQGKMEVTEILIGTSEKDSQLLKPGDPIEIKAYDDVKKLIEVGVLCNDSDIYQEDGEQKVVGDPTEVALVKAAEKYSHDKDKIRGAYERLHEIPFNSDNKYMLTLHSYDEKHNIIFVKGAPETIVAGCNSYFGKGKKHSFSQKRKDFVLDKNEEMTSKGQRVLAGGYKLVAKSKTKLDEGKDLKGFIFTGLLSMKDPLRKESRSTLKYTEAAGIRTVIITGDHKLTVSAIAEELGYEVTERNVVEGRELDNWSDAQLDKRVESIDIYARVSPRHKIRIVDAWQRKGEVVAMLGDGVNDAPALKSANIGVAVGSGTDVAKETADIVLLDDNFKTIVMAVKQGRVIFDNIRKVTLYLLADSFTEVLLVVGALALGWPLPITAIQILYINIITDGFPHLALAFEPPQPNVMKQPPRKKGEGIINKEIKFIILIVGLFTDLVLFGIYYYLLQDAVPIEHIRTIIFMAIGFDSLLYVFSCKNLTQPIWKINLLNNKYLLGAIGLALVIQLAAYFFMPLHNALGLDTLRGMDWVIVAFAATLKIIFIEIGKSFFYKKSNA